MTYQFAFGSESGVSIHPLADRETVAVVVPVGEGGTTPIDVTVSVHLPDGKPVLDPGTSQPVDGEVGQTLVDSATVTVTPSGTTTVAPQIQWTGGLDSVKLATAAAPKKNAAGSYTALRSYSRTAFIDKNKNGIQDAGDVTLAGVKLQVKDANNNALSQFAVTTDSNGKYTLRGVPMRVPAGELWAVEKEALRIAAEAADEELGVKPASLETSPVGTTQQQLPNTADVEGMSSVFLGVDKTDEATKGILTGLGIGEDEEIDLGTITPSTPDQLGSTGGAQNIVDQPGGTTGSLNSGGTEQRRVIVGAGSSGAQLPERFLAVPDSVSVREVFAADFDGDGLDDVAYRTGTNTFRVVGKDGTTREFTFGRAGDQVHVGDFNGDGTDTIALRRGNMIYLRNDLAGGKADVEFSYGRVGDQVLIGDWNDDGKDTIALRRGTRTFVRNDFKGGIAEFFLDYGRLGDVAFVGDWDGDGTDTLVLRRGDTFHFANSLRGGDADVKEKIGKETQPAIVTNISKGGRDYVFVLDRELREVPKA